MSIRLPSFESEDYLFWKTRIPGIDSKRNSIPTDLPVFGRPSIIMPPLPLTRSRRFISKKKPFVLIPIRTLETGLDSITIV